MYFRPDSLRGQVENQDRETEHPTSQGRATFCSSGVGCGGRFFSGGGFGGGGGCLRGSRSGRDCRLRGGGRIYCIDNIDRQATGGSAQLTVVGFTCVRAFAQRCLGAFNKEG
jgi:hypothetical protein